MKCFFFLQGCIIPDVATKTTFETGAPQQDLLLPVRGGTLDRPVQQSFLLLPPKQHLKQEVDGGELLLSGLDEGASCHIALRDCKAAVI